MNGDFDIINSDNCSNLFEIERGFFCSEAIIVVDCLCSATKIKSIYPPIPLSRLFSIRLNWFRMKNLRELFNPRTQILNSQHSPAHCILIIWCDWKIQFEYISRDKQLQLHMISIERQIQVGGAEFNSPNSWN